MIAKNADFQAAPAQVGNTTRLRIGTERGKYRFSSQSRFFDRTDHFQPDAGFLPDALHECFAIRRFTGSAGSHCAIMRHSELVHAVAKMLKRLRGFFEYIFAEAVTNKHALAQTQRVPLVMQRLNVQSGVGAYDGKADGIRAGVNCRDVNRIGHSDFYRQRCASADEGMYFVVRIPKCSAIF